MAMPGDNQKTFFRKNKQKQSVQGYFYIEGKRYLKTLCSFGDLGLDKDGELKRKTKASEARYIQALHAHYARKEAEIELQNKCKPKNPVTFDAVAERWVHLSRENLSKSESTVSKIYLPMIRLYLQYVGDHPLGDMSINHIDEFKKGLASRKISRVTINLHLRTLRAFCNWARKRQFLDRLPEFEFLPVVKRLPNVYTDEEVKKLFKRIRSLIVDTRDSRQRRFYSGHERFLFTVIGTGFRRAEVLFLEWSQIDLEKGCVTLKTKERFNFSIKENEDTVRLILPFAVQYLRKVRQEHPEERYLLDDGRGNLLFKDKKSISQAFRRHKMDLGLNPKVKSIHGFRALFASMAEDSGIDIRMIQLLLNHSDPKVTSIYLRKPDQMMQIAMKKIDKRIKKIGFVA